MKKSILILLALTFVLVFAIGCSEKKPGGKVISFEFTSNPSTGYDWEYEVDGSAEFYLDREDFIDTAPEGILGAPGKKVYYFVATKEGNSNLIFTYKRPWEGGDVAYDVVYELSVDKNMRISCNNKMKGIIDSGTDMSFFPEPTFSD